MENDGDLLFARNLIIRPYCCYVALCYLLRKWCASDWVRASASTQSPTCVLSASICPDSVSAAPAFVCPRWTSLTIFAILDSSYLIFNIFVVIRYSLDLHLSLMRKIIFSIRTTLLAPIANGQRSRARATCNSNSICSRPSRPCPTSRSFHIELIGAYSDLTTTQNCSFWLSVSMRSHQKSLWFWARTRHQDSISFNLLAIFDFALHRSAPRVAWKAPAASLRAWFGSASATSPDHRCRPG